MKQHKNGFTIMHHWYLAYCKAKEESRAQTHLQLQGVESYYPMVEVEKLKRGKRVKVHEPMFPNYLFFYADLESVSPVSIKSTRGIYKVIHTGSVWTPVPNQLIYGLMSRDDSDEARAHYASLPNPGDRVLIAEGPFKGLEAIYQEPDGDQRAILLVTLLHSETSSSFANQDFRLIKE